MRKVPSDPKQRKFAEDHMELFKNPTPERTKEILKEHCGLDLDNKVWILGDKGMIKYRPHRGGLKEAMAESMMFENIADMLKHIEKQHKGMVSTGDIVIGESIGADERVGWNSVRHICTVRYGDEKFDIPYCIAWCDLGEKD